VKPNKRIQRGEACECGCGQLIGPYATRFVSGHNVRVANPSKNPAVKHKISLTLKGIPKSDEHKRNLSLARKRKLVGHFSAEHCHKISLALKGKAKTKEHKAKLRLSLNSERISEIAKRRWQNPMYAKKMSVIMNSPTYKEKRSQIAKQLWQRWDYREKIGKAILKGLNVKPTKPEQYLDGLLAKWFPDTWKYVGNAQLFLGGCCPDFININGQKQIIELFGNYWHRGDNGQKKIKHYAKFGFDCLIIWESELHELNKVQEKIIEFMKVK